MIKNTIFSTISTVLRLLINVVLFIVLARYWGANIFGFFMYPYTVAGLLIIFIDYGFNLQIVKDVGFSPKDIHAILNKALNVKCFLTLILFALCCFTIPIISSLKTYSLLLILLLIGQIFNSFAFIFNLSFRGVGIYEKEAQAAFFSSLITFITVVGPVIFGYGPEIAACGFALSKAFFLFLSVAVYNKTFGNIKFASIPFKEILNSFKKGFPFAVHVALGTLYFQVDTVIIQKFMGQEGVGVYQSGMRLMMAGLLMTDILSNVYLTQMAKENSNISQLIILAKGMLMQCVMIGVAGFIIMAFGANWIVEVIYGKENYNTLIFLLPLFGIVLFLRYSGAPYGLLLTVSDKQFIRSIAVSVAFIVNVILNILMIPHMGLKGALIASIITHIILNTIYVVFTWLQVHHFLIEWRSITIVTIGILTVVANHFISSHVNLLWNNIMIFLSVFIIIIVGLLHIKSLKAILPFNI